MAKDFEQIGHKNLELLRFYVSKDINKLDKKIQSNEGQMKGYILASLVDILIVFVFDEYMQCTPVWIKICYISGLLFFVLGIFAVCIKVFRMEE